MMDTEALGLVGGMVGGLLTYWFASTRNPSLPTKVVMEERPMPPDGKPTLTAQLTVKPGWDVLVGFPRGMRGSLYALVYRWALQRSTSNDLRIDLRALRTFAQTMADREAVETVLREVSQHGPEGQH